MRVFLKKQWPLIALGGLLVLVSFYLIRSGKQMIEGPLLDAIVKGEGLKLKDIHYTHNDPNKEMKWSVDALEVSFSEDKSFISFREFLLKLEPEDRPCFELKGKKGDYSRKTGTINLSGDLEGRSENGYRFFTEHMIINEKRGYVKTNEAVRILGPFFSIEGNGLFVDLEKERIKILSDVTTIVTENSLI